MLCCISVAPALPPVTVPKVNTWKETENKRHLERILGFTKRGPLPIHHTSTGPFPVIQRHLFSPGSRGGQSPRRQHWPCPDPFLRTHFPVLSQGPSHPVALGPCPVHSFNHRLPPFVCCHLLAPCPKQTLRPPGPTSLRLWEARWPPLAITPKGIV